MLPTGWAASRRVSGQKSRPCHSNRENETSPKIPEVCLKSRNLLHRPAIADEYGKQGTDIGQRYVFPHQAIVERRTQIWVCPIADNRLLSDVERSMVVDEEDVARQPGAVKSREVSKDLAGLEIEMKFTSNRRYWWFEISIRDQQPLSTNIKLDPGSDLGSCDLGSGKMFVQPSRRSARAGETERSPRKPAEQPAASSGTIPASKNPGVALPGIEPGLPWWEGSGLAITIPREAFVQDTHSHYCFLLITGSQLNGACLKNCRPITTVGEKNRCLESTLPPNEFAKYSWLYQSGKVMYVIGSLGEHATEIALTVLTSHSRISLWLITALGSHLCEPGFESQRGRFRIFGCENCAGRCHWSTGFLGDLPFLPPLHSGATLYSPHLTSPSSALKTSILKAARISSSIFTHLEIRYLIPVPPPPMHLHLQLHVHVRLYVQLYMQVHRGWGRSKCNCISSGVGEEFHVKRWNDEEKAVVSESCEPFPSSQPQSVRPACRPPGRDKRPR
ncbi:hypothetical protein PR048_015183 [Dryococelus australis]|uniref:Uncharacterized protein n=1 Tax=Dryococelus australis TaxID=614101 RepID=A0ABQ9HGE0_9NEOP|nr:hypothetical protein PR048_015183 [Dryococelus australis]